ncbi:unnamed protein product [Symbiodinium sp. CCMP2592]|nr:unnamed protein product [Symbiodinium sp. CCMP2592]
MDRLLSYAELTVSFLWTFVSGFWTLSKVPREIHTSVDSCNIEVPRDVLKEYSEQLEALAERLRRHLREHGPTPWGGRSAFELLVGHRALWVFVACATSDVRIFFAFGLLQFVLAPFSLACSLMIFSMYLVQLDLPLLISALVLSGIDRLVPVFSLGHLSSLPTFIIEINYMFVLWLLLVDFLVTACFACWRCPDGKPKQLPLGKQLYHMAWGTFQSKTYLVLVLLMCRGQPLNLAWLVYDWAFGVSPLPNNYLQQTLLSWECFFYHTHRMAHLPGVYEQAHRLHHFLPDGTAWDAHVFSGNGFPEEWFTLMFDIFLMVSLGLPPSFMTIRTMKYQLLNKIGHQRLEVAPQADEYHADHHLHHRRNYGFNKPMLDIIFDTYKTSGKTELEVNGVLYTKEVKQDHVVIHMKVVKPEMPRASRQSLAGWQLTAAQFLLWCRDATTGRF